MVKEKKDKVVEEMMILLNNNKCSDKQCEECSFESCCMCVRALELLYDNGYRKIDKDSVLLTRKEFDVLKVKKQQKHWLKTCNVIWENAKIDVRKETAKSIFEDLLYYIGNQQQFRFVDEEYKSLIDCDYLFDFLCNLAEEKYGLLIGE